MNIVLRKAVTSDSSALTELTFKSKSFWNYPEEYMRIWKDELVVSEEYIRTNHVIVAEVEGNMAGYYSLINRENDQWSGETFVKKGYWLDNLFILPDYIKQGIGTELIKHAKNTCRNIGCNKLAVFSDPHSMGFYIKQGFTFVQDSPSSIPGRTIPILELELNNNNISEAGTFE